MIRNIKE